MLTNKEIIERVNDAFRQADMETFLSYCADDIEWNMVGSGTLSGVQAIRDSMKGMEGKDAPVFTVDGILAEGEMVACEGDIEMTERDGKPFVGRYCDVYRLRNGKIYRFHSYAVKNPEPKA